MRGHPSALQALCPDLRGNSVGDSGAQALAALKDAASLYTLSLDLCGNSVGDSGAQALAALKDAASLYTLSLDLCGNSVGDIGAQALAALKDARLDLLYTGGAQALAASCPSIFVEIPWETVGHRRLQR